MPQWFRGDGGRAGAAGAGGGVGMGVNGYATDERIGLVRVFSSVYPLLHPLTPEFQLIFRGSADYRRAMAGVLARRAVEVAWKRASTDTQRING